jgi:hypothetical protein
VGAAVGDAAGVAWPQAITKSAVRPHMANLKRNLNCAPREGRAGSRRDWICTSSDRYLRYGGVGQRSVPIVNAGSAKVIVTRPTLVRGRSRPYDARNLAQVTGEGHNAGKLFLEAQEQA